MLKLFSHKSRCIGLDIGENTIKMVEVQKAASGYQIVNFASVPVPAGAIDGDVIRDPAAVSEVIRRMFSKMDDTLPAIATAIAGQSVFIRYHAMPPMPKKELGEAVMFEAEALLPMPITEVLVDFFKIGEIVEVGKKKEELMIVAARKNMVEQLHKVIYDAGLETAVIDIEPLALLRTMNLLGMANVGEQAVALVDIGASNTTVSIFQGSILRFTRTVAFGGDKLTKVLMDDYQLTYDEAEATKKMVSLNMDRDTNSFNVLLHQKTELLIAYIENLITEIRRSLEYYRSRYRDVEIAKVVLSGGGAQMTGMVELIQDSLDVPVELLDPAKRLDVASELTLRRQEIMDAGPSLAVAIGLALSEVN